MFIWAILLSIIVICILNPIMQKKYTYHVLLLFFEHIFHYQYMFSKFKCQTHVSY